MSTNSSPAVGPSVTSDGEQAFFQVRTQLVEDVLRRVVSGDGVGAALLGEEGSGKTVVLRVVAHRASRTHHVIRMWASRTSASEPYRAIAFLLAELEAEQAEHPLTMFQGICALLEEQANGRPVVLAIDNAEHLDPESATIISRLVIAGRASVLIAAESLGAMDESFARLWREGDLERFDLQPLTRMEIRSVAEAVLGAPLSPDALEALWRSSEGNARFLRCALEELPASDVSLHGGAWVSTGDSTVVPSLVRERIHALLDDLHPRELEIVRVLALAGSLPAAAVRRLAGRLDSPSDAPGAAAGHLDALQSLTVLETGGGTAILSLRSPLVAAAVRGQTTATTAAVLHALLTDLPTEAFDPADLDPAMHAEWLLLAGLPVPRGLCLAAARRCTVLGQAVRARFWITRHPAGQDPEGLVEAARCAFADGHPEEARALMAAGHLPAGSEEAPGAAATTLLILRSRAARLSGGSPAEWTALLDEAEASIDSTERDPGTPWSSRHVLEQRGELAVARAEAASFGGDYRAVLEILQDGGRTGWTPEQGVSADALLCEALALTDQQHAAVGLARSLEARLGDQRDLGHRVVVAAWLRLAVAHYAAGSIGELAPAAGAQSLPWRSSVARSGAAETVRGVVAVLQGRSEEALELLFPVARQLERQDPHGLLPLVAAGLAHSHAETGAVAPAIGYLPLAQAGHSMPWAVRALLTQIQLGSSGLREPRMQTGTKLGDLADAACRGGAAMLELTHRLAQVRAGDARAAEALAGAAARVEGAYAAACALYAQAVASGDAELFAQAMEHAHSVGDSGLARDCATQAIQTAQLLGARSVLRDIQRRARQLFGDITEMELSSALERLTKREREVAQLAARGASNKDIAARMEVTIRTVEGHLYQIYSKLHLRARSELADLVLTGER
ncbi:helix-turn-helix transcriptional regulator [Arthrobacter sp. L77]|uniref:helix-turn-helix transcriptional regulator n=1 Tax=Arthrobacter sp. L77 TaxID=1496689 RepID=UPI0005BAFD9C|nr:LuxR C-terminal-related transcriptional regulator [Arthrobacter sp. L77]